jgi:hypothetical protein
MSFPLLRYSIKNRAPPPVSFTCHEATGGTSQNLLGCSGFSWPTVETSQEPVSPAHPPAPSDHYREAFIRADKDRRKTPHGHVLSDLTGDGRPSR